MRSRFLKKRIRRRLPGTFRKKKLRISYKSDVRRNMMQNLRSDNRLRLPMPPRFRTELTYNYVGFLPIANGATDAWYLTTGYGYLKLSGNNLFFPIDTSTGVTAKVIPTIAPGTTSFTNATLLPAGLGDFMGANATHFYTKYRCLASSIKAVTYPQVAGDAVAVVIFPTTSIDPLPASVLTAGQTPMSKGPKLCTVGNNVAQNVLKHYMSTSKVFGLEPSAVLAEDGFAAVYNAGPANLWSWFVCYQLNDAATPANPILIDIQIKYYVEFEMSTGTGIRDQL